MARLILRRTRKMYVYLYSEISKEGSQERGKRGGGRDW